DVTSCAGVVWLERVTATAQWNAFFPSVSGLRVANCASVTLLRCTFQASIPGGFAGPSGAPGLDVSNSTLAIYDGELIAIGTDGPYGGPAGASFTGGFAFASGAKFQGGAGGSHPAFTGDGGPGVFVNSFTTLVSLGSTFTGGPGGTGPFGGMGAPGP